MITYILLSIFSVSLLIQLYYVLFYFTKILRKEPKLDTNSHKAVSVIICAHNESVNLKKLLPILLSQNYHKYEIVVVNDRSYDETEDYLKELFATHSDKIKIVTVDDIPSKMDPKKYALTLGIKAAKHDYVLLTDADCVPYNNNWILQMQSHIQNDSCIVLGVSQYKKIKSLLNSFIRFETFITAIQYLSFAIKGNPYMGVGRNLMYHKSIFFDNKGFHPHMDLTGGDDDLFINKVANNTNTYVAISIESQTISIPKVHLKEWVVQKTRHLSVGKHYSKGIKFSLFSIYFSNLLFIFISPFLLFQIDFFLFVVYAILFRWILIMVIFGLIIKKLRFNFDVWIVPFFDILYPIYQTIIGINARFTKKVKWR